MADYQLKEDTAVQTVIDDGALLADGARAAGDYDNSANLDPLARAYLTVQYNAGPPAANLIVGTMWVLPGDGAGTEVFPPGGDAAIGTDDDPQAVFQVAVFECINPSTSVDEALGTVAFNLYGQTNRFVIRNDSGQEFDATWQLDIKPMKASIA